jgi:hypothetical protein
MDRPIPYAVTEAGALAMRIVELEEILRHLDRHSLDLWLYASGIEGTPDRDEWAVVIELIREVRDDYGLRSPDR